MSNRSNDVRIHGRRISWVYAEANHHSRPPLTFTQSTIQLHSHSQHIHDRTSLRTPYLPQKKCWHGATTTGR